MKKSTIGFLSAIFLTFCQMLPGSNVATQTVTFSIQPISEISFSGDPAPMIAMSSSIPGQNPADVVDNTTFFALTSNGFSEKLTAALSSLMPNGTALSLMIEPPTGATSTGFVDLDTSNQNLITGITQIAEANLQVTYIFSSTALAGTFPLTTRIVTFTLSP